jgi:serine/threonine protein kinase
MSPWRSWPRVSARSIEARVDNLKARELGLRRQWNFESNTWQGKHENSPGEVPIVRRLSDQLSLIRSWRSSLKSLDVVSSISGCHSRDFAQSLKVFAQICSSQEPPWFACASRWTSRRVCLVQLTTSTTRFLTRAMLLSTHGASALGKSFRRSIKHTMKPSEGSRTSSADNVASTASRLKGGLAL